MIRVYKYQHITKKSYYKRIKKYKFYLKKMKIQKKFLEKKKMKFQVQKKNFKKLN